LPIVQENVQNEKPSVNSRNASAGTETILLVEDEEALRELTRDLLVGNGYTVLEADSPEKAIRIASEYRDPIHLLLTDVIMPRINGRVLAQKLTAVRPAMKVVYMSGYAGFREPQVFDPSSILLTKPFKRETLLRKVRDALTVSLEPQLS
jgi:DNA-binding NtrC family response regulator